MGNGIRFVHSNFSTPLRQQKYDCLNSTSISHTTIVLQQQECLKRSQHLLVSWLHCSCHTVDADTIGSDSTHPPIKMVQKRENKLLWSRMIVMFKNQVPHQCFPQSEAGDLNNGSNEVTLLHKDACGQFTAEP